MNTIVVFLFKCILFSNIRNKTWSNPEGLKLSKGGFGEEEKGRLRPTEITETKVNDLNTERVL